MLNSQILKIILVASLFAVLGLQSTKAGASDAILERSYLRDESGRLSYPDVQSASFTPYAGVLNQGYQPHTVYWIRLKIPAIDQERSPRVLRLQPVWHDVIELFDPADLRSQPRITGDRSLWRASEFPSLNHAFIIKNTPKEREIFLRVSSVHTYLFDAQLLEQPDARNDDWKMLAIYFAYVALVIVICLWAGVNSVLRPEPVLGSFSVYQFINLVYCTVLFGVARVFLDDVISPERLDTLAILTVLLTTLGGLIFHRIFIGQFKPFKPVVWILNCLLCLWVGIGGLVLAGEVTLALQLNALGLFVFAFVLVVAVWLGLDRSLSESSSPMPRWAVRVFYTLIFLILVVGVTPVLGLLSADSPVLHIFLVHNMFTTLAMGGLLLYRARRQNIQQIEQLAISKQRADLESQARLRQAQFMGMLNHEIKTPLSVLKFLVADHPRRGLAEDNIDTISMLLNRCLLSDKLEAGQRVLQVQYSPVSIIEAAIDSTEAQDRFRFKLASDHKLVGDSDLFSVCVTNLLDNALKYSPTETTISVELTTNTNSESQQICLKVCNRIGRAGVPEIEKVFDKYYRAESAKTVPGTGLGLYLTQSFATMMGGTVQCEINQDSRTICFLLCLPL